MTLDDLRVKPGDPVQPFVEKLLAELPDLFRLRTTSDLVRLIQEHDGVNVVVDLESAVFMPRFNVTLSQGKALVGEGYVNGDLIPRLNGVALDGIKNGKVVKVPPLKLDDVQPDSLNRTWVALKAKVSSPDPMDAVDILDPGDPEALTIVHVNALADSALQPLAMIKWDAAGKKPLRAFQITMHNQVHRFQPADPAQGIPARHYFAAA